MRLLFTVVDHPRHRSFARGDEIHPIQRRLRRALDLTFSTTAIDTIHPARASSSVSPSSWAAALFAPRRSIHLICVSSHAPLTFASARSLILTHDETIFSDVRPRATPATPCSHRAVSSSTCQSARNYPKRQYPRLSSRRAVLDRARSFASFRRTKTRRLVAFANAFALACASPRPPMSFDAMCRLDANSRCARSPCARARDMERGGRARVFRRRGRAGDARRRARGAGGGGDVGGP